MKSWWGLLVADLRRVGRSPGNVFAMLLFGGMVLVLIHFTLPPAQTRSTPMGTSALWVALLLSGVLGLPPLQHHPEAVRFLPQLMTSELGPGGYFWEKMVVGWLLLALASVLLFPVAALLFGFPLGVELASAFGVVLLGTVGADAAITLCSALTVGREAWLLPVLVIPLLLPVALAGSRGVVGILPGGRNLPYNWLHLLVAYDGVMVFGGWFLSEFLWEELPR